MKRVLVTGGSGFIGTNLVELYLQRGWTVLSLDRVPPRNGAHMEHWRGVDLLEMDPLASAIAEMQPEWIFHLAGRTDLNGTTPADYRSNTQGVRNILRAAELASFRGRMVLASSPSRRSTISSSASARAP